MESSNGKIVITASVKDGKEWQDWLQDFQLKSNTAWIVRNTFPSRSRATFRTDYTVCKAKLSVKIKPITGNTRTKDKYVKVGMINTYFSLLGTLIIGLTETISAR